MVLDLDGVARYSVFTLYNPYRVVIDCERAHGCRPSGWRRRNDTGAARSRQHRPGRDRLRPRRPATPRPAAAVRAACSERSPARTAAPKRVPAPPPTPSAGGGRHRSRSCRPCRLSNTAGGFSLARQLGLGISRIVIDPGHGGHDPGAHGHGLKEAELTLDIALRLEKLLQEEAGST